MSATALQEQARPSLLWRVCRGGLVVLFYCWAGKAGYLLLSSDFAPHHGFLARSYLAARDSFHDLPETLGFLFDLVGIGLGWLHQSLAGDLGYDPLTLPDFQSDSDLPGMDGSALRLLGEQMLHNGAALLAGQFAVFFVILGCGGRVGWAAPGLPLLLGARARLFYWLASVSLIGALAFASLHWGLLTALGTVVLGLVALRFPVFAGLPVWLLDKVFGLQPQRLFAAFWRLFLSNARLKQARAGRRRPESAEQREGRDKRARGEDAAGLPEGQDAGNRYQAACATFELKPGLFDRSQLRQRYRDLMKKVHPDRQGSARLAMLINADYEFVLDHHGWKR